MFTHALVVSFLSGGLLAAASHREELPPSQSLSPDTVICRLASSGGRRVRVRSTVGNGPASLAEALQRARDCLREARATADPRWLGRAEGILAPWAAETVPPTEVLVLRGTLRQSLHDFSGALEDLSAAVERNPRDPSAWSTKAAVHLVRAEYGEARAALAGCVRAGDAFTASVLGAQLAGLDGDVGAAVRLLENLARARPGRPAEASLQSWVLGLLGELELRRGRPRQAEVALEEALRLQPGDPYLLTAWADLALADRRWVEVERRLAGYEAVDGLLLRLVEARFRLGAREAGRGQEELAARFKTGHQRGERVHLREEARFELRVCGRAKEALALGRANWEVQREPADASLLLEAAQAANDAGEVAGIRAWVARQRGCWGPEFRSEAVR
jgi:Tfp pilus assembly protein PilF